MNRTTPMHPRVHWLWPLLLLACTTDPPTSVSTTGDGDGSGGTPPTTSTASPPPGDDDTTTTGLDMTSSEADTSSGTCDFLLGCYADVHPDPECDIWNDDCPDGEKCTFWANDGGNTWNATRCVPLDPAPVGPGEACTADSPVSGLDDCEAGSMCWNVEDGEGTCIAFCVGDPGNPTCEDPEAWCSVGGGPLAICNPTCDPLDPAACPEGQGCFAIDQFACAPLEPEAVPVFEACEYLNQCEAGAFCAPSSEVGVCDAEGCCTPYCDLSDPSCPAPTECIPFDPDAPESNVGFCGQAV